MSRIWRFAHILWLSILLIYPSNAEDELGFHDIRLISEKNAVSPEDKHAIIAVDIALVPNWKTYWRSPGQTGIPLKFSIVDSNNLIDILPLWPAPKRFVNKQFPSLSIIGYKDRLILPLHLVLARKDEGVMVVLDVSFSMCNDVCIGAVERVGITLPIGTPKLTEDANKIKTSLARVPTKKELDKFRILAIGNKDRPEELRVAVCYFGTDTRADIFIEDPTKTSFVAPLDLIESQGAFKLYVAKADSGLASNQSGVAPLAGTPITLTFVAHDLIHEHKRTVGLTTPDRNQFCLDK